MSIPLGIERKYQKRLRTILQGTLNILKKNVIERLPELVEISNMTKHAVLIDAYNTIHVDKTVGELTAEFFESSRVQISGVYPDNELAELARTVAIETEDFNRRQVGKVFKSVIGFDLLANENFLPEKIDNFVFENVALIKNVQQEFVDQTQRTVFEGYRKGLTHKEISQKILGNVEDKEGFKSRFRKAITRANLIARDQVNKLNGNLAELRQRNVGIKEYIWRTAKDARVRDTHAAREGKRFSWDDPPDGGSPGEAINCRCYAEPVFDNLI
jgi:SPP1 gp7 family putative phage head morphogenesis protein